MDVWCSQTVFPAFPRNVVITSFFKTNVLTKLCLHYIKERKKIKQIERQNYKQIENAVFLNEYEEQ